MITRLGIIGLSAGNGHPYSWSAIINGYDAEVMSKCPFPVIPKYLSKQKFPESKIRRAKVTHIWTQDLEISMHVASASRIENVVLNMEDMISEVDGILLARDDAENHHEMCLPFLKAGLPIYIDKPLAFTKSEARRIFELQCYPGQVFSCSAFRFANELSLDQKDIYELGGIRQITAKISKDWSKYSVHIIEPAMQYIDKHDSILSYKKSESGEEVSVSICWKSGLETIFSTLGAQQVDASITLNGDKGNKRLIFCDTFSAFKSTLENFLFACQSKKSIISEAETMRIIEIIEIGRG